MTAVLRWGGVASALLALACGQSEPNQIAVPAVFGMEETTALTVLRDAGFRVEVREGLTNLVSEGEVFRTTPPAESVAVSESVVTVYVAEEITITARWRHEAWASWEAVDERTCRGAGQIANLREGATAWVQGPDGRNLTAKTLSMGSIESSQAPRSAGAPDGDICGWDIEFPEVPQVAAYSFRIQGDEFERPGISWEQLRRESGHVFTVDRPE